MNKWREKEREEKVGKRSRNDRKRFSLKGGGGGGGGGGEPRENDREKKEIKRWER